MRKVPLRLAPKSKNLIQVANGLYMCIKLLNLLLNNH